VPVHSSLLFLYKGFLLELLFGLYVEHFWPNLIYVLNNTLNSPFHESQNDVYKISQKWIDRTLLGHVIKNTDLIKIGNLYCYVTVPLNEPG
jgi:hypothetical protein